MRGVFFFYTSVVFKPPPATINSALRGDAKNMATFPKNSPCFNQKQGSFCRPSPTFPFATSTENRSASPPTPKRPCCPYTQRKDTQRRACMPTFRLSFESFTAFSGRAPTSFGPLLLHFSAKTPYFVPKCHFSITLWQKKTQQGKASYKHSLSLLLKCPALSSAFLPKGSQSSTGSTKKDVFFNKPCGECKYEKRV